MAIIPSVDPTRRFAVFKMSEIYTGPNGVGRFVPNVDDMVVNWNDGIYRVISVDHYRTNLSKLERVNIATMGGGIDPDDMAVVTGVGMNSNSFRVYVNTSTLPHALAVDSRVRFYGPDNAYIKIFKGVDTSEASGIVISAIVNSSGNVISENIPLVKVMLPNATNVSVKTPNTAWCSETVKDGDIVTIVTYTAAGVVTSRDKFVIDLTNRTRSIDAAAKYITNIELITPFLSQSDKRVVNCPINLIMQSLNFSAKVTYSDHTSRISNIDGNKWGLAGMNMFISSQIGKQDKVFLTYKMAPEELALDSTAELPDRVIVKEYTIRTVEMDAFYSVKLFAVPRWNSTMVRYELDWYLYNLDREQVVDVTNLVEYTTGSPQFNGTNFSGVQTIQIAINMQKVSELYSYFRHVQVVSIALKAPGSLPGANTYYEISYGNTNIYGNGVSAKFSVDNQNPGKRKLDISAGYSDSLSWLDAIYTPIEALYYDGEEMSPPTPSHVRVVLGSGVDLWVRDIPISDVVKPILDVNYAVAQGTNVRLELYQIYNGVEKHLAQVPMVANSII